MNGGVAVTLGDSVPPIQEQDATAVKSDPNAIVPFSVGRATLLGAGNLRIETGWQADRALYNVVRGADLNRADIQAAFGPNGFVCSTAARSLIESAGFKQLANPARGGVCGAATQVATTNFTLNQAVATTTTLSGTSVAANKAALVAKVTGATAPFGRVSFYDGTRLIAAGVRLVNGQATRNVWNLTPGSHSFKAVFVPASAAQFDTSQATGVVSVLAASAIRETFVEKVRLKRDQPEGDRQDRRPAPRQLDEADRSGAAEAGQQQDRGPEPRRRRGQLLHQGEPAQVRQEPLQGCLGRRRQRRRKRAVVLDQAHPLS